MSRKSETSDFSGWPQKHYPSGSAQALVIPCPPPNSPGQSRARVQGLPSSCPPHSCPRARFALQRPHCTFTLAFIYRWCAVSRSFYAVRFLFHPARKVVSSPPARSSPRRSKRIVNSRRASFPSFIPSPSLPSHSRAPRHPCRDAYCDPFLLLLQVINPLDPRPHNAGVFVRATN